ncbi:MAG TPA: phosphate ABC transporter permease subunit PstC [Acidobacteriota bacterium]|nr:phosphate ABC transporter permease subunit PstC [Acidobacteriota bacterium]
MTLVNTSRRRGAGGWRRRRERAIALLLLAAATVSILTTAGIVFILFWEAVGFFSQVPLADFLAGTRWTPLLEPRRFGVLPLVCGTLIVALGALLIAVPVGVGTALYLSEFASATTRKILKPVLEVLAGVPTVVYGYFALTFITPMLRALLPSTQVFNAASAAIVVGVMVLPMVASLSDDAFKAVPRSLRNGGYALGGTSMEVSLGIVLPAALSGIVAAFVLAFSRAVGETMAVTLAAGATPKLTFNYLQSIQTMTAYIAQVSQGDVPAGTLEYRSIFAVGALLFAMTLSINILANRILKRYREAYQ